MVGQLGKMLEPRLLGLVLSGTFWGEGKPSPRVLNSQGQQEVSPFLPRVHHHLVDVAVDGAVADN